ncbi:MAG: S8 family serine peptidase [Leeuwenhoekiella sp.]
MKLIFFFIFVSVSCFAQEQEAIVYFIDKEDIDFYLQNPSSMLSQNAIDRKTKYNTDIDLRDVPVNEEYIERIKSLEAVEILSKSKWLNSIYIKGSKRAIDDLLLLEFVTGIEFLNKSLNSPAKKLKIDHNKNNYQFLDDAYNYGDALNQIQMIDLISLHNLDLDGTGIDIAVMDSGFPNIETNPGFAKLNNENRILYSYDFVDRSSDVRGTGSHGSQTLSTMTGYLSNEYASSAPQANYYLFRTEFAPTESPVEEAWLLEALERADSLGVDIVNISLGYRDFDNSSYNHIYEDLDGNTTLAARAANLAFEKGMLLITSAGNGGQTDFKTITTPADSPNVLTIGAVDPDGNYAVFSSQGPTVDGRIKPDVVAQGQSTAIVNTTGDVQSVNGTSFSSPIVAGAVACLWQALPSLDNEEILQLVRESGHLYTNPTNQLGYGIPNFQSALDSGLLLDLNKDSSPNEIFLMKNPVHDVLIFSIASQKDIFNLSLYNMVGSQILEAALSSLDNTIDISHLANGLYIAAVKDGNGINTFKILKR